MLISLGFQEAGKKMHVSRESKLLLLCDQKYVFVEALDLVAGV